MKIKIFSEIFKSDLEKEVNKFIAEIEKDHMEVKDIKFTIDNAVYIVLMTYGPDDKIYVNYTPFKYEESN